MRQKSAHSESQDQTKDAFSFKWTKRDTYESASVQRDAHQWLLERYTGGHQAVLDAWLKPGAKVLDAGCGSGYSAIPFFGEYLNRSHYLGVDISNAVDVAAERFKDKGLKGEFLQADILNLPFSAPLFDVIFSEGVLHHTDSTRMSLRYLSGFLLPGGRFMFYVYRKKGPIREFTDDHIREYLKDMGNQEAWDALIPLTNIGKVLGDLRVQISIPRDIPYLGIQAGSIDLQRLFYWYVFKAFYKPDWTIEEMNHVNFDWYRPLNCHRHTTEEIQQWCKEAGLIIEHMNVQEAGITVVAIKK
ncbi:MAG: methyltransferase domain-containing protein [Nitrospirae bacterium]|nr:methyltransferase domain-containing protein [Nitrospirota bacterium]